MVARWSAETDLARPDQDRSRSPHLILELARRLMRMRSAWDIRWSLYAGHDESNRLLGPSDTTFEQERWRWLVYHADDLIQRSAPPKPVSEGSRTSPFHGIPDQEGPVRTSWGRRLGGG